MGSLVQEMAADIDEAISEIGQTFEWKGNTYPCARNTKPGMIKMVAGGEEDLAKYSILVSINALPADGSQPEIGDMVDEDTAQIIMIDPNLAQLMLYCGSPDATE